MKRTTSEDITHRVLSALNDDSDPRLGSVMRALVTHLHDFAREVRLQPDELFSAARFLTRCGQISDSARHEFLLLSDTLGLTMVVDTLAAEVPDGAFETSVLGPFYRAGAPLEEMGADLARGTNDGERTRVHGRVLDVSGEPIAGAMIDVWSTDDKGLYENVDPEQPDYNLRGRFRTDDGGRYDFWTVKPVSYPVPSDGPAGDLLYAMNRHNMRPAHIHFIVSAADHRTVISELFTDDDEYINSDAVFGVKPSLVVHYEQITEPSELALRGCAEPYWDLSHDVVLVPGQASAVSFTAGTGTEVVMT